MTESDLKKFGDGPVPLDATDLKILAVLQDDCKTPLTRVGEMVDLSPPAVIERVRKLEQAGVIRGYHAIVDARRVGLDLTAFIGVSINYPKMIASFERDVARVAEVLECHHVTGEHSLLLKVKTWNTASLETLISRLRSIEGVLRTDTMVVFSTRSEKTQVPLTREAAAASSPPPADAGVRRTKGARRGAKEP